MADTEHLIILKQGVGAWNTWREAIGEVKPDLSRADLTEADLAGADLTEADLAWADLYRADLVGAHLSRADLSGADLARAYLTDADLSGADLTDADLSGADLTRAHLYEANLSWAELREADLTDADLTDADLTQATLVNTDVSNATLTDCTVYGISVWNLKGEPKEQSNLLITREEEPAITVDDLRVAQFIYFLVAYPKLKRVIDTITSKVVLLLGRFSDERKPTLDAMADLFRQKDYVPVKLDFERSESQSFLGTVETLARMARFVVADVTDAQIVDTEVAMIARAGPPILPVLLASSAGGDNVTLVALRKTHKTILDTYRYQDTASLLMSLEEAVIEPANAARAASIEQDKERSEIIAQAIRERWPTGR